MRVLLVAPPFTQFNAPYASVPHLLGFLKRRQVEATQFDLSLQLILKILSAENLALVAQVIKLRFDPETLTPTQQFFLKNLNRYLETIGPTMKFLQGQAPELAQRLVTRRFLPEGPRFKILGQVPNLMKGGSRGMGEPLFGTLSLQDFGKHLATLYVDDVNDVVSQSIDNRFVLSRYAESLSLSAADFTPLETALAATSNLIEGYLEGLTKEFWERYRPQLVGYSVPFPGNFYATLRSAKYLKKLDPSVKIVLGGGYFNTELRTLNEPRVFKYVDYVTLDDGEMPMACLLDYLEGRGTDLRRTFLLEGGQVRYVDNPELGDVPQTEQGTPCYENLPVKSYFSLLEVPNTMQRLWSDGWWNKVRLAHGCYWHKCRFCDVSLDYICRFEPTPADLVVQRLEEVVEQTGSIGFHFVDEAAPPALLRAMSERIIAKKLTFSWWTNIRFEKSFTPELAGVMARAGCIGVSGGLETATDSSLKLMNKGVTLSSVREILAAFKKAKILVHAYLMYGFPGQNLEEVKEALGNVRGFFREGMLQSAHWHRFTLTVHSPIGQNPAAFGLEATPCSIHAFARNAVACKDHSGVDWDKVGAALRKATYNYLYGNFLGEAIEYWFADAGVGVPGK